MADDARVHRSSIALSAMRRLQLARASARVQSWTQTSKMLGGASQIVSMIRVNCNGKIKYNVPGEA